MSPRIGFNTVDVDAAIATHAALTDTHGVTTAIADTDDIDTHAAIAAAHHARYTDAEADARADAKVLAHATGGKHRWTSGNLLKGAGAGADPTEITTVGVVDSIVGCTTGVLTYYVDYANGSDGNPGTEAEPFRTIAYTIGRIPKIVRHSVTIYLKPGTWPEAIDLSEFLVIATPGSPISFMVRGTTETPADHQVTNIVLNQCFGYFSIRYLEATTTSAHAMYVRAFAGYVQFRGIRAVGVDGAHDGFWVWGSQTVEIRDAELSNKLNAVHALDFSHVYSLSNTGTGSDVGLKAANGSVIAKGSTQPGGTVAEEATFGAVIR